MVSVFTFNLNPVIIVWECKSVGSLQMVCPRHMLKGLSFSSYLSERLEIAERCLFHMGPLSPMSCQPLCLSAISTVPPRRAIFFHILTFQPSHMISNSMKMIKKCNDSKVWFTVIKDNKNAITQGISQCFELYIITVMLFTNILKGEDLKN